MLDPENRIRTDKEFVSEFCNTLNAWQSPMRHRGLHRVAEILLDAQRLVTKLFEENRALKGEEE